MSSTDTTTAVTTQEQAQTPAPRSRISYTSVESAMGIMDTARFEHLGRVATVMARAGLLPDTLRKDDKGEWLPFEVVQARAYLVANQADLWHADPMAVAQCTSLVYGRLMYEGKLVHGIVSARLGVDLNYEFGVYNPRTRDIDPMPADGLGPDDQGLGVRVSGLIPGETTPRTIAGSVKMWHKGAKSPWATPEAWPRQLRYMGAREWTRAHKPSLLLGILTDDEVDEYQMARETGAIGAPPPQMLHAGFEDRRPAQIEQGPGKPRAARSRKPPEPDTTVPTDLLDGDDIPPEGGARPTETAQSAEAKPATSEAATDASTASPEPSPPPTEPEDEDSIADGAPQPDEVYHLEGDTWNADNGRRETYKNGQPFSSAGRKAAHAIYLDHAPQPATEVEEGVGQEEEGDVLPKEFSDYITAVEAAGTWAEVKVAMATFYKTPLFVGMAAEQKNKIRADTWDALSEKGLKDLPDHASDVSAFRLWIEHQEDADAIRGTLRILEGEPSFETKEEPFKKAIREAVSDRLDRLGAS